MKTSFHLFLIGIVFILSGCQGAAKPVKTTQPGAVWPTAGWQISSPEQQGMDPVMLKKMQEEIANTHIRLHSLLIVRNGAIIWEEYYSGNTADTKHAMYSVTKSFVSTLVGIAIDQEKIEGTGQRVFDLLPGRTFRNGDERKGAMSLEDLLTMSSGLDWVEGDATYSKMYSSADWVQMVLDHPMAVEAGKEFLYCSGCSHVLSAIVGEAVGEPVLRFAEKNLFQPLGITNLRWETDRKGIAIGGWGLNITPRDMAKLGYLFLNQGAWDGKQIVSSRWVQAATTRHIDTDGELGYGYQWWIYPTHNAYTALGRYGQTIFVAPDLNLIVVTTAQIEEGHDPIFRLIDDFILPAAERVD